MDALWSTDLAPLIFVALFGAVGWLGYPIAQALRRRIEGKSGLNPEELKALREEMVAMRETVEHTRGFADRLMELEERVDFTERVLARGGEVPGEIGPGADG